MKIKFDLKNRAKNAFNKMKTPQVITELLSLNGELKVGVTNEKEISS